MQKKSKRITFLIITAAASLIYFYFYHAAPQIPMEPVPESAYSWNPILKQKKGDVLALLQENTLGDLLGYTLYQGKGIHRSPNNHDTKFYDLFTKQQNENVLSEIFATFQIVPSDLIVHSSQVSKVEYYVHIAIVKDLPELPLNIAEYETNLLEDDLEFTRMFKKGLLKDSDYCGLFDVQIKSHLSSEYRVVFDYTLFYIHKKNLLIEIARPGKISDQFYCEGGEESAYNFTALVLINLDLGIADIVNEMERYPCEK